MNQYREIIGKLNYGLFLAIVALLPFDQLLLRYAFVTWFVCWLLEGRWLKCRARIYSDNDILLLPPRVDREIAFGW